MIKLRSTVATLAAMALTASLAATAVAIDDDELQPLGVYDIEGITWILKSQTIDGELVELPDQVLVSLLMEDGQAGGQGACNNYFSSYELDGFDLTFGETGSTMMACLPPVMDIEQAYFANLGQVTSYQSGGIQMAFLDADGNFILEFDAVPPATVVGAWAATGINNQVGGVVSSATTPEVTAEFSPGGDLTGFDGCNDYLTTYVVDGDTIAISEAIGSTRMACSSEELAEESQWYYGALASAATWSVDASGDLRLRDIGGSLQVGFAPTE